MSTLKKVIIKTARVKNGRLAGAGANGMSASINVDSDTDSSRDWQLSKSLQRAEQNYGE